MARIFIAVLAAQFFATAVFAHGDSDVAKRRRERLEAYRKSKLDEIYELRYAQRAADKNQNALSKELRELREKKPEIQLATEQAVKTIRRCFNNEVEDTILYHLASPWRCDDYDYTARADGQISDEMCTEYRSDSPYVDDHGEEWLPDNALDKIYGGGPIPEPPAGIDLCRADLNMPDCSPGKSGSGPSPQAPSQFGKSSWLMKIKELFTTESARQPASTDRYTPTSNQVAYICSKVKIFNGLTPNTWGHLCRYDRNDDGKAGYISKKILSDQKYREPGFDEKIDDCWQAMENFKDYRPRLSMIERRIEQISLEEMPANRKQTQEDSRRLSWRTREFNRRFGPSVD